VKNFKKVLGFLLRVSISAILLAVLFSFKQVDVHGLINEIKSADKAFLLLAFFIFLLMYFLGFLRWQMLLRAVKVNIPLKRVIKSCAGGLFFSLFLPSTVGGDVARSIDLARYTQKPKEIVATVLLDRLSGYVGLVIVILFALSAGWKMIAGDVAVLISVGLITGILGAVLLILFNKFLYRQIDKLLHLPNAGKIRTALKSLFHEIHYFREHKKILFYNILISILIQLLSPLVFYVTALAIGIPVINPVYFFIFVPIIGAITLLPISLGGFGLRENTAVIFFAKAGVAGNSAAAMAFLNSIFILIAGAIGGLIYVLTVRHRRAQYHQTQGIQP
jgi:hypothetical protein